MSVELFVFYLLSLTVVAAALMVISARNPVHSVLFLILAFFNAAGLFVLAGAEFLAMVLVVVYVGAVAVLFMFVVMMLDIDIAAMREGFLQYLPIGAVIGLILLVEIVLVTGTWALAPGETMLRAAPVPGAISNTEALGNVLYTDFAYLFQIAGLILLVAIIGAITLTLRDKGTIKRQDIGRQVHKDRRRTVELRQVEPGQGVQS